MIHIVPSPSSHRQLDPWWLEGSISDEISRESRWKYCFGSAFADRSSQATYSKFSQAACPTSNQKKFRLVSGIQDSRSASQSQSHFSDRSPHRFCLFLFGWRKVRPDEITELARMCRTHSLVLGLSSRQCQAARSPERCRDAHPTRRSIDEHEGMWLAVGFRNAVAIGDSADEAHR